MTSLIRSLTIMFALMAAANVAVAVVFAPSWATIFTLCVLHVGQVFLTWFESRFSAQAEAASISRILSAGRAGARRGASGGRR